MVVDDDARRRRARRHHGRAATRIAFDLGTTTVVATLLDLATGTPARGRLDAQQAAALRRRRDHPDQRDDDGPATRSSRLQRRSPTRPSPSSPPRCAPRPASTRREVYEVALAGNATMTAARARHRPRAAGRRAVRHVDRSLPTMLAADLGFALHPRARAVPLPGARRLRRRRHRRRHARHRAWTATSGLRLFIDVGTNCEIVLGDGERALATAAPGRARPSRAARSAAACAPPTAPSRSSTIDDDGVQLQVIGDVEPVGLCGSGLVDAVAELVARRAARRLAAGSSRRGGRARSLPALADRLTRDRRGAGLRAAPAEPRRDARRRRLPLPARRARAAVRQGGDLDRLDAAARGARRSSPPTSSRCCSPARSAATCRPASAVRIGLVPQDPGAAHRQRRQRRGRGRQDGPAVACASGPARWRCWRR